MDPILRIDCCSCSGTEKSTIADTDKIASYKGEFKSPLQFMWYVPEKNELLKIHIPDAEIRSWIKDAADYHGVPHAVLAVILQQENNPDASKTLQTLQFGERSLTTFTAILDKYLWDVMPDKISKGSSGFANMSYNTLKGAAEYTEKNYRKNPMPDDVRYRLLGYDQDTRVPGDDYKADLYYAAAHIRELIDRVTGNKCHSGELIREQIKAVFKAYNGSGKLADKYATDAMAKLDGAIAGHVTLCFYQR